MWFIIVVIVVGLVLGFAIRAVMWSNIKQKIQGEAEQIGDYVRRKCLRDGMDEQEARRYGDNFAEDFLVEIQRSIRLSGPPVGTMRKVYVIRDEFLREIDARFRG